MSNVLGAALAAQTVLAFVVFAFAVRAWLRVRDTRLGLLALGFMLLLGQTVVQVLAAATELMDLETGFTAAAFIGLGALLALYLAILRP